MKQLWFTSEEFKPLPGEEEKTNPGRFGEALAYWVKAELSREGYNIEEKPIPEDWGWIIMLHRKPFSLWVGCGNEDGNITRWCLFVEAEQGLLHKLFGKIDPALEINAVEEKLVKIVTDASFKNVEWEQA